MIIFIYVIIFLSSIAMDIICHSQLITISLILSFFLSASIVNYALPILKTLKIHQIIRQEGPKKHLKKSGIPTMGGVFIVPIGILIANILNLNLENYNQILAISFLILGYMIIGIIDDLRSLIENKNTGLSANSKLILQIIIGLIFLKWSFLENWINSNIFLFSDHSFNAGILIWPISLFVLLAESNSANLTDGLDGLASGCGALIFTGIAFQLTLREGSDGLAIANLCLAMAGSWLGFLIFNKNPAKIFMGDTGSLAMGAGLGGIALITNSLWALLIMGGILLSESLSVILQVSVFKATKKIKGKGQRIFLMAPLHHHYELKGVEEKYIVKNFWITTIFLICIGIVLRSTS